MLATLFHTLALILNEDPVAREAASKSGLTRIASDLLNQWDSSLDRKEKQQVPKMGHSCFYRLRQVVAGNTQEGIQKYFEALKVDPHYAPAYYNLGMVYSEMMQYDMALTFYEKASSERPMYAEAYCNMDVIFKNEVIWKRLLLVMRDV
ncbi:hypothetical protein RYX36_032227 [Vicia faba]